MADPLADDFADRLAGTTYTFGGKLPAKLRAMREAGFVATEFWIKDLFEDPRGPDYAIGFLRDSGLRPCAYQALRDYEGSPPAVREHVEAIARQMMEQMHWIGTDLLILCTNMREDASGERSRKVDDLGRLADLARSFGIRVAYEHVCWGRHTQDYREAWSLVEEVGLPNLGIMLDSLHIFCPGLPLDGIDRIDPDKIFLVELADIPATRLGHMDVARHYRLMPGDGVAPVEDFIRRVEAIGYQGLYSIEIMNDRYLHDEPGLVAKEAIGALRAALGRARA